MSIVSQRITLIVTLCIVFGCTLYIDEKRAANYEIAEVQAPELATAAGDFHYGELEKAVASFRFDAEGKYIPDAKSVYRLSIAMENNLGIAQASVLDRFEYLLKKQIPPEGYEDVFPLMQLFVIYAQRKVVLDKTNLESDKIQGQIDRYHQLVLLQNEIFGNELAEELFGDQRRLSEIIFSEIHSGKINAELSD
jgi:hypothetical protein